MDFISLIRHGKKGALDLGGISIQSEVIAGEHGFLAAMEYLDFCYPAGGAYIKRHQPLNLPDIKALPIEGCPDLIDIQGELPRTAGSLGAVLITNTLQIWNISAPHTSRLFCHAPAVCMKICQGQLTVIEEYHPSCLIHCLIGPGRFCRCSAINLRCC